MKKVLIFLQSLFQFITILFFLNGCVLNKKAPTLVPDEVSKVPNYWCTWYWQNYLIKGGEEVTNPDPQTVYTNPAAREQLNEETLFGENGMAKVISLVRGLY